MLTAEWYSQEFNLNAVHTTSTWGIRDARAKIKYGAWSSNSFILHHAKNCILRYIDPPPPPPLCASTGLSKHHWVVQP